VPKTGSEKRTKEFFNRLKGVSETRLPGLDNSRLDLTLLTSFSYYQGTP
jgi:hypothetical protein